MSQQLWHGRLSVELRLLGLLGAVWVFAAGHAIAWTYLVLDVGDAAIEIPWVALLLPQAIAACVTAVFLYFDLPRARWPREAARRPSSTPFLVAGAILLPLSPLLISRHRKILAEDPPGRDATQGAFEALLRLPRTMSLRYISWASAAFIVDALVLGYSLNWPRAQTVALAVLWIALLAPTGTLLGGYARALVRPEYLAAQSSPGPNHPRADLRLRITVGTMLASAGAVLAPLCIGYLWYQTHTTPSATSGAAQMLVATAASPRWAFVLAAVVIVVSATIAATFVARDTHRDVVRASERLRSVIEGQPPQPAIEGTYATRELRALVGSVDRLVERIAEANIAKYVAIEKAKEVDRLKSQFLANMSHDLRSPLNSILGFSELLLSGIDGELLTEQRDMVATVLDNGRQLLQEIDDILDTAKIEASRLELHAEPTPPAALVNRAIAGARKRQRKQIEYTVDAAAGLPPAFCDPYRTVQAIENVLLFASERMDEGKIEIDLRLGKSERGRMVFVSVRTPIRPATAEQLARARRGFFRIPGHRGLGLALPLAGSILELEGGALGIEDLESGMVFSLQIAAPSARRGPRPSDPIRAVS